MPWSVNDYPASMKNLSPEVREKAIEVANSLYEKEHYEEDRAIPIAISTAEEWAKKRGKKVKEDKKTS